MNRELLEKTSELLRQCAKNIVTYQESNDDIAAMFEMADSIDAELAKPEPVGNVVESGGTLATVSASGYGGANIPVGTELYIIPTKRERLSVDEISAILIMDPLWLLKGVGHHVDDILDVVRSIEKAHGIY